ncbi:DegV family protein [Nocardioides ultimimeridianus]
MRIGIVTDSTAELSAAEVDALGVTVVPLQVVIDDTSYDACSPEVAPDRIAEALRAKRSVSTSRPAPAAFGQVYERLAAEGAEAIVSIHLSAEVSGTFESAELAARTAPVPVTCVDTRQVGFGTGYAAATAAAVVIAGGSAEDAAKAAVVRSEAARTLLYVDTLEYLRRGGRIGGASALVGGVLAVKPLLGIEDGVIAPVAKVRTAAKAIARLEELAVDAAGGAQVEVGVAHLASAERAQAFAERLAARLGDQVIGELRCVELGGVIGAHVGPGMLAVCVAPVL